ncbi:dihydrolipoyl dehydrogenase [Persephonella sp.]
MYDLIIIGMGPGGYEATLTALRKGLNIAIVEKSKVGGNCLNRACIPTKYFWTGAHQIEKLKILKEYGINLEGYSIDYTKAWEGKEKAISFLRKSLNMLLKTKKVPVYKGTGKIIGRNQVEITKEDGSKEIIDGKYILIATGSVPASVGNIIPDGEYIITTEDFLEKLKELPEEILIVGGGVAGCEIGYIMASYGSNVHIVELMNRLLPMPDIPEEVSRYLLRKFKKLKINTYFNTTLQEHKVENGKIIVKLSDGTELKVDKILLSIGRKPNSDIDTIGIDKDEKGFIKVNSRMQTNFENIYACGDVVNSPMLAYIASYEAKVAIENITGKDEEVIYKNIPYVLFSGYEIATIGLTPEQAKEKGIEIISGYYPYTYNEKAVDEHESEGFVRLVFENDSKKLLGGTIVGTGASELIHILELALNEEFTAEELHNFIYFHPSLSEILAYATYDIVVGKLF